jgi:hypothetical protein
MSFDLEFSSPTIFTSDGYGSFDGVCLVTGSSALVNGAKLLGAIITNQLGSTIFAGLYDGYAAPVSNAKPILELQIAANSQGSMGFGDTHCVPVSKGIVIAASTTSGKYVASASSMFLTALYIK